MMASDKVDLHTFEIRPRHPDQPLSGLNALILMDGKPLKGVRAMRLDIEAGEAARLWLDLIPGSVSMIGSVSEEQIDLPSSFVTAIEDIK